MNATLTSLNLSSNLGPEGGDAIAAALRVNTALETLDLSLTGLDAEAGRALAEALEVNTTLWTLKVQSFYDMGDMGDAAKQALRDAVAWRYGFELMV